MKLKKAEVLQLIRSLDHFALRCVKFSRSWDQKDKKMYDLANEILFKNSSIKIV